MINDGLIDTNVVVHSFKHDERSSECAAFLAEVQAGSVRAEIHPLVVHELTYVFKRHGIFRDDASIAEYLRSILTWPGIIGEIDVLDRALLRWGRERRVAFVDAYLIEVALAEDRPVYTINVRDFAPFGVTAPRACHELGAGRTLTK